MEKISAKEIREIEFYDIEQGQVRRPNKVLFHLFKSLSTSSFGQTISMTDGVNPIESNLNNQGNTTSFVNPIGSASIQQSPMTSIRSYNANNLIVNKAESRTVNVGLLITAAEGLEEPTLSTKLRGLMVYMEYN